MANPYTTFRFLVEFDYIVTAGFSEISGLTKETEVETFREGGNNSFEYKIVKGTKYTDLVMKRGILDLELWDWYNRVSSGDIERQNGTIYLLDSSGETAMQWNFWQAYPIKWEGPQLNATSNTIATESITLVHHGISYSRVN